MLKRMLNRGVVFSLCHLLTAPLPTCKSRASVDAFPEQNLSTKRQIVCARRSLSGGHVICGVAASNSPKELATHESHASSSLGSILESEVGSIAPGTSVCPQRKQQSRREDDSRGPI